MGYRIHDRDFIARLFSRGHKNGFRLITQLLFRFERGKILLPPFKGRVEQTCIFRNRRDRDNKNPFVRSNEPLR